MQEHNNTLNENSKDTNSKGITPLFNLERFNDGIAAEDIKSEAEQLLEQGNEASISTNLKTVLATRKKLKEIKASEIRFSLVNFSSGF